MSTIRMIHRDVCPLCGSKNIKEWLRGVDGLVSHEEFPVFRCNACTFVFTQTLPAEEDCQHYYDSPDYTPHKTDQRGWIMRCVHFVRVYIRQPFKLKLIRNVTGKKTGTLIDIGCGTGEFPAYLQKKGWNVRCIEPNTEARAYCRSIGLNTDDMDALEAIPSASFDVVALWHVLEHVYDIHGTMETVRRLLKPDGAALIAIPHYDCPEARWYGPGWSGFELPRHPSHFTPVTLKSLASEHGLDVVEMHALNLDDVYLAIVSEKYIKGSMLRGWLRGIASAILSMFKTTNGGSIVYVLKHRSTV